MNDIPTENTKPSAGDPLQGSLSPLARAEAIKLRDRPDWLYLLREFYEMYRRSSAGGSKLIRAHQRAARESFSKAMDTNPEIRPQPRQTKPVCAHLKRALDRGRLLPTAPVIRAIESIEGELSWVYGYDSVPKGLSRKFAYAELIGGNGPVVFDGLIAGLVLFAPACVYPAHSHDGITESYFCLSGAMSENDDGVYAPGSLIFNPPGRSHRITVDSREPCLLAYAWTGPREKLAGQKLRFSRSRA